MYLRSQEKGCDGCLRPPDRRLGLFQAYDDYECYADGYVKCFWGLCDRPHKSHENILKKTNETVITIQPTRRELPYEQFIAQRYYADKF